MYQSFCEERLLIGWDDERVHDDVVNEISPHRGWIAEIIYLHRCRPVRHDLRSCAVRVALEIDQDVDAVLVNARGGVAMRQRRDIDEAIEDPFEPPAHGA